MKILKIIGKVIFQFVLTFISVLVMYLAIISWGAIIPSSELDQGKGEVKMFVQSNGVHTDVCFPVKSEWFDWTTFIDTCNYPQNSAFKYVAIGWGDKGFFLDTPTWSDLKTSTAISAIFLPSPCAMHVEYKSTMPIVGEMVSEEHISSENYLGMIEYVKASFLLKDDKPIFIPGTSYWGTDHFFEANGNYHMLNTCNSWTNGALKAGGLKTASFAAFPGVIMSYRN
jgi:uncharacterized protein (TIGR02117 family)